MNELSYEEHLYIAEKLYECRDFLLWLSERIKESGEENDADTIAGKLNEADDSLMSVDDDLWHVLIWNWSDIADDYVYPESIDSRKKYLGTAWHVRLKWERDYE